jgi:ubiquinone biosynthesis UbiH/UbiF/VisC/COQ6 family hydroxylase
MSAAARGEFDVLIVGAGIIGCVMASLLVARKLVAPGRVAVVAERFAAHPMPDADWDLRVFALSRASERLLSLCGIWSVLPEARISAYERMCVWEEETEPLGKGSLCFDSAQIGEPNLGYIVDGGALQWQCLQAARGAGAVLFEAGLEAVTVDEAEVGVRLNDGRSLRGQLLIGADGPESATRRMLGIETAGHAYHQDALVAHIRTEKPHHDTAWQRFLRSGPLALLPLADGRSSIVWSAALPEAARLRALNEVEFGAAVTAASAAVLGQCVLSTPPVSFPLKLQYATRYAQNRAVLLGDAAHVVHPLAGQGMNLGLLDCAALAQVLEEAGGARYFGEYRLLRRFERWRRSENLLAATTFDGLERMFSTGNALTAGARRAGFGVIDKVPMLKNQLAQRALGLSGDLPDFLKAYRASPRR